MKKRLTLSLILLTLVIFSCSKSTSNGNSNNSNSLIVGKWFEFSSKFNNTFTPFPGNGSPIIDSSLDYYTNHEYVQFNADGSWTSGCDTCTTIDAGTYLVQNNDLYVITPNSNSQIGNDTNHLNITLLTSNSLNLYIHSTETATTGIYDSEGWFKFYK